MFFYVHTETWENDPIWQICFKSVETINQSSMALKIGRAPSIFQSMCYFSSSGYSLPIVGLKVPIGARRRDIELGGCGNAGRGFKS